MTATLESEGRGRYRVMSGVECTKVRADRCRNDREVPMDDWADAREIGSVFMAKETDAVIGPRRPLRWRSRSDGMVALGTVRGRP